MIIVFVIAVILHVLLFMRDVRSVNIHPQFQKKNSASNFFSLTLLLPLQWRGAAFSYKSDYVTTI